MKKFYSIFSLFILLAQLVLLTTACSQFSSIINQSPPISKLILSGQENIPQLVVQLNHASPITAIALSDNGRYFVTASWDQTLRLWDAETGQELRRFNGHKGVVKAVSISPDSEFMLSGGNDGTARLWNTKTGKEIFSLKNHTAAVNTVCFSPDGKFLLTGSDDMTARIWHRTTGQEYRKLIGHASEVFTATFTPDGHYAVVGSHSSGYLWHIDKEKLIRKFDGHQSGVRSVDVSPDGQFLLTGSNDHYVQLWDINKGQVIQQYIGHTDDVIFTHFGLKGQKVYSASKDGNLRVWNRQTGQLLNQVTNHTNTLSTAAFSRKNQLLFAASENSVQAWDVINAQEAQNFKGNTALISDVAFSPNGRYILISNWDDTAHLWDTTNGRLIKSLKGHTGDVRTVMFSDDGTRILTGSRDNTALLWDTVSGNKIHQFNQHSQGVRPVDFSSTGRYILTGSDDGSVWLWHATKPYTKIRQIGSHSRRVTSAVFSPDGQTILTASENNAYLWRTKDGKQLKRFNHEKLINAVDFSADGQRVVTSGWDNTAKIWNLDSNEHRILANHSSGVNTVKFSPNGRFLLSGSEDQTAILWDVLSGEKKWIFSGHSAGVTSVAFSPDGQFILTGSSDQTVRLLDAKTGIELCRIINFKDNDWAVVDQSGRFDAANGGDVIGLHWVVGRNQIALNQLKERYYDPGLLTKKMGLHPEPVREVASFENPKLFPKVTVESLSPSSLILKVTLVNQGGGIGKVSVSLNGKEIIADARTDNLHSDAESLTVNLDLTGNPFLNPGEENFIDIQAFNSEGYLSSRGVRQAISIENTISDKKITLWAIVAGISDYDGDRLDLRFAAKDAKDIANAMKLGGQRLFGADQIDVNLLTTANKNDLVDAFTKVQNANPWDVLIVYFAGHGIAIGDDYYFLTREARSTELSDPSIRSRVTISSSEMMKWLKLSPALKQVMILDTCQAGAAARKLVEQREITSGQVRALERLKDRTGFHILMGSAANSVSYEASQYEQGLLTYALLKGMKGLALRDNEFIDVSKLFQYAADEVPILATHIGGIQRPRIAAPKGTSFEIGQLIDEDRAAIPLSIQKPILLQPMFLNETELSDNLRLTSLIRKSLRDKSNISSRNTSNSLSAIYLDTDQVPGAIQPTGTYIVEGDSVTVNIALSRGSENLVKFRIQGIADNPDSLIDNIVNSIFNKITEIN